ncbi:MAG TPA: c-type cytochrome [Tepidisphaeraceae bacterium]|jgi:putative heme-binding domain-containing protein|nr:c-type cytochrome [Tepidisphaeraceae bacterium]
MTRLAHRAFGCILVLTTWAANPIQVSATDAPAPGLNTVVTLLEKIDDPTAQADVLRGVSDALKGRRQVAMPAGWRTVYAKLRVSPSPQVREQAIGLALVFGDADAIAALRDLAADAKADPAARRTALAALVQGHEPKLGPILLLLLDDPALRGPAIRGLAGYSEEATPRTILQRYATLSETQRHDAINTLGSRPAWAAAMLDAVEGGKIPRSDVSAYTVRQLMGLNDKAVGDRLSRYFGALRPPAQDKAALIATYKKTFTADVMAKADAGHGRAVFNKTCAACHTLFDAGGKVGPDLTGSQRANLDYVLENVVDPSAVVANEYLMTLIQTTDDRTINGIIKQESDASLTLRTTTEDVIVPKGEIKKRKTSPISMMPEGLLEGLGTADARDLIAYLASPYQVPAKEETSK